MESIQMTLLPERMNACVFTGHREIDSDFSAEKLSQAIDECIARGCVDFYCGMAKGFDLLAGAEILKRKRAGKKVRLIACIPYPDQPKAYDEKNKALYNEILKNSDEQNLLFTYYTKWCMMKRNEYMVDRSDVMIAYLNADKGGTFYTVNRFLKRKKGYIFYCNERK